MDGEGPQADLLAMLFASLFPVTQNWDFVADMLYFMLLTQIHTDALPLDI